MTTHYSDEVVELAALVAGYHEILKQVKRPNERARQRLKESVGVGEHDALGITIYEHTNHVSRQPRLSKELVIARFGVEGYEECLDHSPEDGPPVLMLTPTSCQPAREELARRRGQPLPSLAEYLRSLIPSQ